MKIIQQTAHLLPEESVAGIYFPPIYLFHVPPDAAQQVHPVACRLVDNTDFLLYVGKGYGWVIPQFPDVPHDIGPSGGSHVETNTSVTENTTYSAAQGQGITGWWVDVH
jgi:hypothetical protein